MKFKLKVILISCVVFCLSSFSSKATQVVAGEITYRCLDAAQRTYQITTNIYYRSLTGDSTIIFHYGDGNVDTLSALNDSAVGSGCSGPVGLHRFQTIHSYSADGNYIIHVSILSRIDSIVNIPNSANASLHLETVLGINPFSGANSSPIFTYPPLDNAMLNFLFIHNPVAVDPDGDSLSYEIIPCYGAPGYFFPPASNSFGINAVTGDLTWDSPMATGYYSVGILIKEWRNTTNIGTVYRDMMISVCQQVGIDENIFSSGIKIFPNPSDGNIQLSLPITVGELKCKIANLLGEKVFEKTFSPLAQTEILNLSFLCRGIYVLRLSNDKNSISKLLAIE